jgi:hypothetical protein
MLLLASQEEFWGICLPPAVVPGWRPAPEDRPPAEPRARNSCLWPRPTEPLMIPAWRSEKWNQWEPVIRRLAVERFKADFFKTQVLHPDDLWLIEAARIIYNGELPHADGSSEHYPRAWKFEGLHSWWILELPFHLSHDRVRQMMREQGRQERSDFEQA